VNVRPTERLRSAGVASAWSSLPHGGHVQCRSIRTSFRAAPGSTTPATDAAKHHYLADRGPFQRNWSQGNPETRTPDVNHLSARCRHLVYLLGVLGARPIGRASGHPIAGNPDRRAYSTGPPGTCRLRAAAEVVARRRHRTVSTHSVTESTSDLAGSRTARLTAGRARSRSSTVSPSRGPAGPSPSTHATFPLRGPSARPPGSVGRLSPAATFLRCATSRSA